MKKKTQTTRCETCAYYDAVDDSGELECTVSLDEDEVISLASNPSYVCPYYKFYDEYKFVRTQN